MAQSTGPLADDRLYLTLGGNMNDHVNPAFSNILAAVAPPKEAAAHYAQSAKLIEEVAAILCSTATQRVLLERIYSMGRADGLIEAAHVALEKIRS